jgi:hypothetical protein
MQLKVKITGIVPLLMANIQAADKRNPIVQERSRVEKMNRGKAYTEERQGQIDHLAWLAYLYQRKGVVVLPADNLLATVQEGAKLSKLGQLVKQAGLFCTHEFYPLDHDGPADIDALYADGRFVDSRMGCLQGRSKVLVVRPVFPRWSCSFNLEWDEEVIDREQIIKCLTDAGARRGIGTWRPRFGRFIVEVLP